MKKAIKIALTTMVILCMMLGVMHWFKSHQEEKRLIRQEQERMVEYTLENYEDIRKVEFTSFEQNFSTGFWHADAIINDNIYVSYTVANLSKKAKIWIGFHVTDSQGRELKKRSRKREKKIENVNIIYKEN